jgi:serine/threonine protein phosphatase PrpC
MKDKLVEEGFAIVIDQKPSIKKRKPESQDSDKIAKQQHLTKKPLLHGVSETIGRRSYMEDTYATATKDGYQSFAVFDGHAGKQVSDLLKAKLPEFTMEWLSKNNELSDEEKAIKLKELWNQFDLDFCTNKDVFSAGSTAAMLLADEKKAIFLNSGDTEGVLFDESGFSVLSNVHCPKKNKDEISYIKAKGGMMIGNYICGYIAVSRSFGDKSLRNSNGQKLVLEGATEEEVAKDPNNVVIMANPDVKVVERTGSKLLIIASDGFWDCCSYQETFELLKEDVFDKPDQELSAEFLNELCADMVQAAYDMGSKDNITVMLIANV